MVDRVDPSNKPGQFGAILPAMPRAQVRTLPMVLLLALSWAPACGDDGEGGPDASAGADTGSSEDEDAGPGVDAAALDASPADAQRPDVGVVDAGVQIDAGVQRDAGVDPSVPADMRGVLELHNQARAETNSGPMTWHAGLAETAATWAAECRWEHAPANQRVYQGQTLGENLSAGSGSSWTPTALTRGWIEEEADYDCPANTCAPGKMCGHYTQVIWRSSTQVGCAIHDCTTGGPFGGGTWRFLVCRYMPAGNFVGQRPVPVADCPP